MNANTIYAMSPILLQNLFCSIYGAKEKSKRYGGIFSEKLNWLNNSQWASKSDIEEYQSRKLVEVIEYCYNNVPYYQRKWNDHGIDISLIKDIRDVIMLPMISKDELKENVSSFISNDYSANKLISVKTSGTTGKSLSFYHTIEQIQFQWAVWWRHRQRFGVNVSDRHATFTGKTVVPFSQQKPPFWRENRAANQTLFNMQHITKDKIKYIIDKLNKEKYVYFSGYPSIIYSLCRLILDEGLFIKNPPKFVFTGAEKLYDFQIDTIKEVLRCQVSDQYGFSEGCGNASKCEYGVFHEDYEFGLLEPHNVGDSTIVVATGFAEKGMPLIRYQVGDNALWSNEICKCGRQSKVIKDVEGRIEDFVITPEGATIKRCDYIFKNAVNIIEAQVIQDRLGEMRLLIVKNEKYCSNDEEDLIRQIRHYISPTIKVNFEYVNKVPRETSGKYRAVKSNIKSQNIEVK